MKMGHILCSGRAMEESINFGCLRGLNQGRNSLEYPPASIDNLNLPITMESLCFIKGGRITGWLMGTSLNDLNSYHFKISIIVFCVKNKEDEFCDESGVYKASYCELTGERKML